MIHSKFFFFLMLSGVVFFSASCKKCKVDGVDINSGEIVDEVVLYPTSGYMTPNMGGEYVIGAGDPYASRFEVSFDGGAREAVNYTMYTILAQPVVARCNASFERNVTVDHAANKVTYTIKVTQCSNCKEERYTENYVLVPAFPSNYQVVNVLEIVDKE
jgi:hypothetical protein